MMNNVLYFILDNKAILLSKFKSENFNIKSGLNFIPDECSIVDVLLLLNPDSKIPPLIDLSGNCWEICFYNKQVLNPDTFILKEDNIYYCNNKEELLKIIDHNNNIKYVVPH